MQRCESQGISCACLYIIANCVIGRMTVMRLYRTPGKRGKRTKQCEAVFETEGPNGETHEGKRKAGSDDWNDGPRGRRWGVGGLENERGTFLSLMQRRRIQSGLCNSIRNG